MSISCALRFPDFIGIGAQKAGTTWLHSMLRQHPDVWLPPVKELHYFDRLYVKNRSNAPVGPTALEIARKVSALDLIRRTLDGGGSNDDKLRKIVTLSVIGTAELTNEWYGKVFQAVPRNVLCGEITPEYALLPGEGMGHIAGLLPDVKLIFIMRDPIDRCWSALRMMEKRGEAPLNMERRISRSGFIAYSDYKVTIERVLGQLPESQLLLLYYDDLVERPAELIRKVLGFLGLDASKIEFEGLDDAVHAGSKKPMDADLYDSLRQEMEPIYRRLLTLESPTVSRWYQRHYGSGGPRMLEG